MTNSLLAPDEPPPFLCENEAGSSAFVLTCEHGGRRIPKALDSLGLDAEALDKHFTLDLGALALARALSERLDAPLVHQPFSRLVCDCNRRPEVASFIPESGEGQPIPGNIGLAPDAAMQRRNEIWRPFHAGLTAKLERRRIAGLSSHLVSIHSFAPVFLGESRPWRVGILYERNRDLSPALLGCLSESLGAAVGDNQPYCMSRDNDFTIPVHGEDPGLACAEIEVRNDQLAERDGVSAWADRLVEALEAAADACSLPRRALTGIEEEILLSRTP